MAEYIWFYVNSWGRAKIKNTYSIRTGVQYTVGISVGGAEENRLHFAHGKIEDRLSRAVAGGAHPRHI